VLDALDERVNKSKKVKRARQVAEVIA